MAVGFTHSVVFVNQSDNEGDVCLFQTLKQPVAKTSSLVWLARHVFKTTTVTFEWSGVNCFVWSNSSSSIDPGVIIVGSQAWAAGLSDNNRVTLTYVSNAYTFENLSTGTTAGTLTIQEDSTLPAGLAVTGIGMDGYGTIVAVTQPNTILQFVPDPQYWISFGTFTRGAVIDRDAIISAEVVFPVNVLSMTAIYTKQNTWEFTPTSTLRLVQD
ncbi:MAG TPA: protein rhiA [Thermoanaerobaculia bacterium]|jgi:hypothetical protein|nr:protein rhiA [Thermoanaerobaculia bacterium]